MNAEVKIAAAPQQAAPEKAKKPSVVDTFLKGCAKGFKVGIENITPAGQSQILCNRQKRCK